MSQKVEKVHNFLDPPPLPQDVLDFFEFGKKLKIWPPPPSYHKVHILKLTWTFFTFCDIFQFGGFPKRLTPPFSVSGFKEITRLES